MSAPSMAACFRRCALSPVHGLDRALPDMAAADGAAENRMEQRESKLRLTAAGCFLGVMMAAWMSSGVIASRLCAMIGATKLRKGADSFRVLSLICACPGSVLRELTRNRSCSFLSPKKIPQTPWQNLYTMVPGNGPFSGLDMAARRRFRPDL